LKYNSFSKNEILIVSYQKIYYSLFGYLNQCTLLSYVTTKRTMRDISVQKKIK